jgi:hypothetical protein
MRQRSRRTGWTSIVAGVAAFAAMSGCGDEGGAADTKGSRDRESVTRSVCPPGVPECRSARGRIVFVERVDPDGDGDAHFVIADPQGITLRGLTAIDVRKGLRPDPLPGIGDLISAAGPVQTGSYGQSQIHALELHVAGGGEG